MIDTSHLPGTVSPGGEKKWEKHFSPEELTPPGPPPPGPPPPSAFRLSCTGTLLSHTGTMLSEIQSMLASRKQEGAPTAAPTGDGASAEDRSSRAPSAPIVSEQAGGWDEDETPRVRLPPGLIHVARKDL